MGTDSAWSVRQHIMKQYYWVDQGREDTIVFRNDTAEMVPPESLAFHGPKAEMYVYNHLLSVQVLEIISLDSRISL